MKVVNQDRAMPAAPSRKTNSTPTMRDVAALAGVSPMTVSRTLHGGPGVSVEVQDRVHEAVGALGYRRNELARSLRQGRRAGIVGVVVTNLANPFYASLTLGVEAVVAEHGLRVLLTNTGEDETRERDIVEDLVARRIDGLIAVPAGADQRHFSPHELGGVPVVMAARPPTAPGIDCVLVDDFGGARAATAQLITDGHRRIGFLGNPPAVYTGAERYRGYSVALQEAGLSVSPRIVRRAQQTIGQARTAAAQLLSTARPPTAIFTANSRNTIGSLRAVAEAGSEVAIAGFDDFDTADVLVVPLTVVAYDAQEIGRQAARLLLDRMATDETEPVDPPGRRLIIATTLTRYGQQA